MNIDKQIEEIEQRISDYNQELQQLKDIKILVFMYQYDMHPAMSMHDLIRFVELGYLFNFRTAELTAKGLDLIKEYINV
jgi:hypothetical protein